MNLFVNRQFRLPRIWSNKELRKIASLFSGDVVNISAWNDEDKEGSFYKNYFFNASTYSITNFSGERGSSGNKKEILLDLSNPLPRELSRKFDVCFNHTTLEHIFDVKTAFANICAMSKDIVILVVPFSQEQHEIGAFKDYWRFTTSCLHNLFEENEFEIIYEAESPYRKAGIYLFFVGSRRVDVWKDKFKEYKKIDIAGKQLQRGMFENLKRIIKYYINNDEQK